MGSIITTIDGIENKEFKNAFCPVRPPGHHAKCSSSAGFCIFNNAAVAAKMAKAEGKKVCIFDWDIHHGDGTQEEFYNDD